MDKDLEIKQLTIRCRELIIERDEMAIRNVQIINSICLECRKRLGISEVKSSDS